MATLYVADGEFHFEALREFEAHGVRTKQIDEEGNVLLTDGANCLWAFAVTDDWAITFESCGKNDPAKIISAIEMVMGVSLISEYEEMFENLRRKQ